MKIFQKTLFISLLVITNSLIFSSNYYVSPNGNDANSGTIDNPYATIQKAHNVIQAGDTILVRGGTYYPTSQTSFTRDGTSNSYIVLRSYPGEIPVIDGENVPDGNINHGSTSTWSFSSSYYWKIIGPIIVTNGRGAGIYVESKFMEFNLVESSYNGKRASRAAHGFMVWRGDDIDFINCDAHHNANHLWKTGEDQEDNQYQHGDGWRIFNGSNVRLEGCRAWNNLDDNFDYYGFSNPIDMVDCWAAYGGRDDSLGTITGTPNRDMPLADHRDPPALWGNGVKLGYFQDNVQHRVVRCVSWGNNAAGYHMNLGPANIRNSVAFENKAFGFDYFDGDTHEIYNSWEYENNLENVDYEEVSPVLTSHSHNSWDGTIAIAISDSDFVSLDDADMLGPRQEDGSLPITSFLRLASGSDLIDAGMDVGLAYIGNAIDIGAFEFEGPVPVAANNNTTLPENFNLVNYPNPFNPSTVIQYDLVQPENVNIVIYDILGRQVTQLENGYRQAGAHTLTWDATDRNGQRVASGTYLLRIHAGGNIKTIKMAYIR